MGAAVEPVEPGRRPPSTARARCACTAGSTGCCAGRGPRCRWAPTAAWAPPRRASAPCRPRARPLAAAPGARPRTRWPSSSRPSRPSGCRSRATWSGPCTPWAFARWARWRRCPGRRSSTASGFPGLRAWELARGDADRPLRPRRPPRPLRAAFSFPEPVGALPALEAAARLLLGELAAAARGRGGALRGLTLRARLADGGSWTRALTLREATADPARLAARRAPPPGRGHRAGHGAVDRRVDASGALAGHQLTAIPSPADERGRRAREAVRQVRAAQGPEAVLRAVELEPWSRLPERRWALAPYDGLGRTAAGRRGPAPAGRPPPGPRDHRARRGPPRDGPRRPPAPGAGVRDDWLVQDRWWTDEPVDRHYFDLLLEPGRLVVVYREAPGGEWFIHQEERRGRMGGG